MKQSNSMNLEKRAVEDLNRILISAKELLNAWPEVDENIVYKNCKPSIFNGELEETLLTLVDWIRTQELILNAPEDFEGQ